MTDSAVDLSVRLGPLTLPSPITLASGTCGYGVELAEFLELDRLGALFTKGLTLHPRAGNDGPRVAETAGGLINRIGLQNVGIDVFIAEKLPALAPFRVPVLANVAGATVDEYLTVTERLDGATGLAGLELNVSCPNVAHGGIEFGTDPAVLERLVAAVRGRTSLPLVVKLTPGSNVGDLAKAAEAAGADALSAINTVPAMFRQSGSCYRGGLSGPAIKAIALRCVADVSRATRLPIFGVGGIAALEDVLEFLAAGASAVQIGTATFLEPGIAGRLTRELASETARHGLSRIAELVTR